MNLFGGGHLLKVGTDQAVHITWWGTSPHSSALKERASPVMVKNEFTLQILRGASSEHTPVNEADEAAEQPGLRSSRVGEADEWCEAPDLFTERSQELTVHTYWQELLFNHSAKDKQQARGVAKS